MSGFVPVMNCKKLPPDFEPEPGEWAVEEKFDGIRIETVMYNGRVDSWSRAEKWHPLPNHIQAQLRKLPNVILDGEVYAPGKRSYGTTEKANDKDCIYVVFDLLATPDSTSCQLDSYDDRHSALENCIRSYKLSDAVQVASSCPINSRKEMLALQKSIWARDGEGIILKRRKSIYLPGARTKDWLKSKKLQTKVMRLTGFEAGTSEIVNRGPFAKVCLEDTEGYTCTVKTLNDEELENFAKRNRSGKTHPDIGRWLWIEFHERTPKGKYREPRWDRWATDDEIPDAKEWSLK